MGDRLKSRLFSRWEGDKDGKVGLWRLPGRGKEEMVQGGNTREIKVLPTCPCRLSIAQLGLGQQPALHRLFPRSDSYGERKGGNLKMGGRR